ncbi:MAG: hypothetical protein JNL08_14215 [Planctomycetes bacterium]|nr:hypothetical protein [Planctomycetota bacterium]
MNQPIAASMTLLLTSVAGLALWRDTGTAAAPNPAVPAARAVPPMAPAAPAPAAVPAPAGWLAWLRQCLAHDLAVELRRDDAGVTLRLEWRRPTPAMPLADR